MDSLWSRGQCVCPRWIPREADDSFPTMHPFSDSTSKVFLGVPPTFPQICYSSHIPLHRPFFDQKKKKRKKNPKMVFVEENLLYLPSFNLFLWWFFPSSFVQCESIPFSMYKPWKTPWPSRLLGCLLPNEFYWSFLILPISRNPWRFKNTAKSSCLLPILFCVHLILLSKYIRLNLLYRSK